MATKTKTTKTKKATTKATEARAVIKTTTAKGTGFLDTAKRELRSETETKTSAAKSKVQETNYVIRPNHDVYFDQPFSYLKAKATVQKDPYDASKVSVYGGRDYPKKHRETPLVTAYGLDENGGLTLEVDGQKIRLEAGAIDPIYVALGEIIKSHRLNPPEPLTGAAKSTAKKKT
jgi:hypothetical protein